MTGLRVTAGIAPDSAFRAAREAYSAAAAPPAQYLEASSSWALVRAMARRIEAARAEESRLVRVHDIFWLRIWRRAQPETGLPAPDAVEDLLATVGTVARSENRVLGYREI
jgi:hypothetical protein